MKETTLLEANSHKELLSGMLISLLLHGFLMVVIFTSPFFKESKKYQSFKTLHVRLIDINEIRKPTVAAVAAVGKTYGKEKGGMKNKAVIPVYEVKKIKVQDKNKTLHSEYAIKPINTPVETVTHDTKSKKEPILPSWKKFVPQIKPESASRPIKQRTRLLDSRSSGEYGLARRLYYSEVWRAIQKEWALPVELLKRKDLEAIIIIKVRRDGTIVDMKFEKKSGNQIFDESAWNAIKKANPLPPFPKIYSPPYEEFGIRFRPENLARWRKRCIV